MKWINGKRLDEPEPIPLCNHPDCPMCKSRQFKDGDQLDIFAKWAEDLLKRYREADG